jgi:transcription-repair coupling factor (superfamily II helicase)
MDGLRQWIERIRGLDSFSAYVKEAKARKAASLEGLNPSSKAHWAAAGAPEFACTLVVTPSEEAARSLFDDLYTLLPDSAYYFPASELWTVGGDAESAALRVLVLDAVRKGQGAVIVGSVPAVLQRTASKMDILDLKVGETRDLSELLHLLGEMGYERVDTVERPGQMAVRGGILDLFPSTLEQPVRVEFFGDEMESIRIFDVETQRSIEKCEAIEVLPAREEEVGADAPTLLDLLPGNALLLLDEPNAIHGHFTDFIADFHVRRERRAKEVADEDDMIHLDPIPPAEAYAPWENVTAALRRVHRGYLQQFPRAIPWERNPVVIEVEAKTPEKFAGRIPDFSKEVLAHLNEGGQVVILSEQNHRLAELLIEHEVPVGEVSSLQSQVSESEETDFRLETGDFRPAPQARIIRGRLSSGFAMPSEKIWCYSDIEIFGERRITAPRRYFKVGTPIVSLVDLHVGDFVVHINHGIGVYQGVTQRTVDGAQRDYLQINYQGQDKIFVPTDQLDRVQKYIGSGEDRPPEINKLGTATWQRATTKAKARAQEMAQELLILYASRSAVERPPYGSDTVWQAEMEEAFPYRETPDQLSAIEAVKEDLQKPHPMDRLVCGDVGFGKTEVAVRAAFKVATEGKQVAILVPTTVLAQQHYNTFTERMAAFPIKVEMLSRFRTAGERRQVLEGVKSGEVDIVIATHALLGKEVQFHDLGLLVVDEEQRFGVKHKERIKELRKSVDILTLTATPIPRTLHMSLSGLRDMSLINNPPEGRASVKTLVTEYNDDILRRAILRELDRGGQVFVLYNRVERIEHVASRVEKLVPQAKVGVGHGQMPERQLEQIMWDFYHKKFDVLVCSTIIESGIDIPNVNTMLIIDSDKLGLSTLYQLRGRVGRSTRQAYCYMFYRAKRALSQTAMKRLEAIRDFTDLGSGFKVAMRDLEIRGAGNLLGAEQSGYVTSVGFELYCQMIQDAVRDLQGVEEEVFTLPPADLPVTAFIPDDYIPTEGLRMAFYKKLAGVRSKLELEDAQAELEDRFGDPPPSVWNMLHLVAFRLDCAEAGVIGVKGDRQRIRYNLKRSLTRDLMIAVTNRHRGWHAEMDHIEVMLPVGADVLKAAYTLLKEIKRELGPTHSTVAAGAVQRRPFEKPKSTKVGQKPRVAPLQGVRDGNGQTPRPSQPTSANQRPQSMPQANAPRKPMTRIHLGATADWERNVDTGRSKQDQRKPNR